MNVSAATGCMVVAGFYGLRGEDGVEIMSVGLLVDPRTDCGEHVAVDFEMFITESRVVEGAEDIGHYFFDWYTGVFPCIENPPGHCQ
jgi:hypothetical protein